MQALDSWDDLRHFLAVARSGTLAAAARTLGVNQSTVHRRIAQLEEELGAQLFERQPRGYVLTAVGEQIVPLADRVEEDLLALHRAVVGADRQLHGTIRITTVDEIVERVAPHLSCFRERYPGIVLSVNTDLRLFSLGRREADVAIRPGRKPTEGAIVGRRLAGLATAAYASSAYLAGRGRPQAGAELVEHCLIDFSEERSQLDTSRWLRKVAGEESVVYRASSMVGQQIAAAAGVGVAILPCFMGDPDPRLERLFLVPGFPDYSLWLLFHADLRQTARVRAFIDFIVEAIGGERTLYEGTGL